MFKRHRIFLMTALAALYLVLGTILGDAVRANAQSTVYPDDHSAKELTILFTHDLHSYFLPHKTQTEDGTILQQGGYAKLAYAIDEQRRKYPRETLLVDAGDFSMGTLFHTLFTSEALELRLMGKMGYDVTTLGNHDFDFHPDGLAAMLSSAIFKKEKRPALVVSNVILSDNHPGDALLKKTFEDYPVRKYMVLERNGLRIGVFGVFGQDAAHDSPFAKPVAFADAVEASKQIVDLLKNKENVDIIICLSHGGTSSLPGKSEDENLAKAVPQIDVIISGHTHTILHQPIIIGKTIIAAAGCYGNNLGVLRIRHDKNRVTPVSYELQNISADRREDRQIAEAIAAYKNLVNKKFLARYRLSYDEVVAESDFPMESLTSLIAHPGEAALGNLITDAYRWAVREAEGHHYRHVHFALQPVGNIRSTFLKGQITVADVFAVLSLGIGPDKIPGYPLVCFYISGKELKDILEVHTTIAPLKKRDAYLQLSGVKFTYNPKRIWFDRVTSVEVEDENGRYRPLDKNKLYRACANLYTAAMIHYVGLASHGLIKVVPKDQQGRVLDDIKQAIVYDRNSKELKEWQALLNYLRSFKTSSSGLPRIPEKYIKPEGRYSALPSLNPIDLFCCGHWITYGVLTLMIIALFAFAFTACLIIRKLKNKAK